MPEVQIASDFSILRQLAAQSDHVFFLYNLHSKQFDYIDGTFKQIWNTRKKDIQEKWLFHTVHPDDRDYVKESIREFFNCKENKKIEFRILLPKDVVKWISLSAYFIIEENFQNAIIGYADDITEQKEREHHSAKSNARKTAVLEILAHEVKGSMAMIQAMNDQIKNHIRQIKSPMLDEYTRIIGQLCQNNLKMVHALLDSELIESEEMELSRKRLDLVEAVTQLFKDYKQSDQLLNRHFKLECAQKAIYAEVDENLFMQVFHNLLGNALKFTKDGDTIAVYLLEDENQVHACVRDNGIGIPLHLQETLFDRFTKSRRNGLKGQRPTGLGLSIVKRIIELHNGKIWVESEENKGTAFHFQIPKFY